ncbi:MAG TPA: serine hydrolase [Acidimicrobiia bacterium]|nr:serine hydrolase [Acidimicrobiia bacterium]
MSAARHLRRTVFLAFLTVVVSCNGSNPGTTTATTSSSTTVTPSSSPPVTDSGEDSPLDTRLDWLADAFTAGEISESDYQAAFTADFIQAVTYEEFVAVLAQLGAAQEWSVGEFENRDGLSGTALLLSDSGESLRAIMTLETVAPYRIAGLLVQPGEPPTLDEPPADFGEAAARLDELGELELAVMEVKEGECVPVFEFGDGEPMPVGSAIKLYVLGAVADESTRGDLPWDSEIPITDEHRSIPTGVLQDEEVGATFTLREMAETMIAFSDNTATDHLIALVGRDRVEDALADYGMENPSLNVPFMDTMELSALKIGPAAGLATQWLEADEAGRRQILAQLSDIRPSDLPVAEFTEPVSPDRIEWFATPADMCRALARLYDQGEPLTQILTINPGLPDEEGDFAAIAFKGGSEPGLVAMNWLVELPDGRRFVISGSVVNPEENFDQLEATLLFGAVRDLVADQ